MYFICYTVQAIMHAAVLFLRQTYHFTHDPLMYLRCPSFILKLYLISSFSRPVVHLIMFGWLKLQAQHMSVFYQLLTVSQSVRRLSLH